MPNKCVALKCRNRSKKKSGITYYSFPSSVEQRSRFDLWVNAVQRTNWTPTRRSKLCSEHFESDCFINRNGRRLLKPHAVPTIFFRRKKVPKKYRNQKFSLQDPISDSLDYCIRQIPSSDTVQGINQVVSDDAKSSSQNSGLISLDGCMNQTSSTCIDADDQNMHHNYTECSFDNLSDSLSSEISSGDEAKLTDLSIVYNDHSYHLPSLQKVTQMLHDTEEKVAKLQKALKTSHQTLRRAKEKILRQEKIIRALEERLRESESDVMASCFCEVLYEEP